MWPQFGCGFKVGFQISCLANGLISLPAIQPTCAHPHTHPHTARHTHWQIHCVQAYLYGPLKRSQHAVPVKRRLMLCPTQLHTHTQLLHLWQAYVYAEKDLVSPPALSPSSSSSLCSSRRCSCCSTFSQLFFLLFYGTLVTFKRCLNGRQ